LRFWVCGLPLDHVVFLQDRFFIPHGGSIISATDIGRRIETNVMPRMLLAGSETARVYFPGGKSKGTTPVEVPLLISPCSLVNLRTVFPLELSIPMQFLNRTFTRGTDPIVSHVTVSLETSGVHGLGLGIRVSLAT
jgi:hypothetical protein